MKNQIKTSEEIARISARLRGEGKVIVTTNGSFDILHCAHISLFEKAKKEGDVLIVLVNSDDSVRRFKGEKRPIISQEERARILTGLEDIDYVVVFEEDTPLRLLEKIKPHKHVKGGSFVPERIKVEQELVAGWGGEFKNFELEDGVSTTNIIERILERYK